MLIGPGQDNGDRLGWGGGRASWRMLASHSYFPSQAFLNPARPSRLHSGPSSSRTTLGLSQDRPSVTTPWVLGQSPASADSGLGPAFALSQGSTGLGIQRVVRGRPQSWFYRPGSLFHKEPFPTGHLLPESSLVRALLSQECPTEGGGRALVGTQNLGF